MVSLTALWLPILISAVVVFVASSIIHMATRWHANDYQRFPAEDAVLDAVRPFNLAPESYVAGTPYMTVFRVTSTITFAGYALALWQSWIWYSTGVGYTVRTTIDGLIYALPARP